MPNSEPDGYSSGHFNRVYDYILAPACRMSGFWPERADNPNTSNTAIQEIKNLIECDVAICDLSSNNANVLYGLAIRKGLDLPVILIKDLKTQMKFDAQVIEYDDSLRIDTVQKEVEILKEAVEKSFSNKGDVNSWLTRLGIGPGRIIEPVRPVEIPTFIPDMPVAVEESAKKETALPVISPLPDYVGDPIDEVDIERIKVGDFLFHINYGKGEIKALKKMAKDKVAEVHFETGSKMLVLGTSGFWRKVN